jgi:hypothetical protein
MITCGYANAPSGNPAALTIQFDPTVQTYSVAPASVRLLAPYFPVGMAALSRPSWPNGVVPYSVPAGTSITVPAVEAQALISAGVAVGV